MWTAENRGDYERAAARYPSDVTGEEWVLIEPHLAPERNTCRREILNEGPGASQVMPNAMSQRVVPV